MSTRMRKLRGWIIFGLGALIAGLLNPPMMHRVRGETIYTLESLPVDKVSIFEGCMPYRALGGRVGRKQQEAVVGRMTPEELIAALSKVENVCDIGGMLVEVEERQRGLLSPQQLLNREKKRPGFRVLKFFGEKTTEVGMLYAEEDKLKH